MHRTEPQKETAAYEAAVNRSILQRAFGEERAPIVHLSGARLKACADRWFWHAIAANLIAAAIVRVIGGAS